MIEELRADFPTLHQDVNGHPLVYLDNAATSQKPWPVIEALRHYYEFDNANVHRGNHTLADRATRAYEEVRDSIRALISASRREEIVFVRGATEGINLIARCFVAPRIKTGTSVIVSELEHHSNIVPWQILQSQGLTVRWLPVDENGDLKLAQLPKLIDDSVCLIAVNAISNSLGTVNPIAAITTVAHEHQVPVLVDACQVPIHTPFSVRDWDCDFCVFSSHKMLGPTGTGVLYGKYNLLDAMPPWLGGGDMIDQVGFDGFSPNELPYKFEAGTPNIADVIAFGAAVDYLRELDREALVRHEALLLTEATRQLQDLPGVRIVGTGSSKAAIVSFVLEHSDLHPSDIGAMLDQYGVAVRAGHHCTMPILKKWGLNATCRASFAFYNTLEEVEILAQSLEKIISRFNA